MVSAGCGGSKAVVANEPRWIKASSGVEEDLR